MSDTRHDTTIAEQLSAFLSRRRRLLIVVGAVLIVSVFGSVIAYQVHDSRMERAARSAELISDEWQDWQRAAGSEDSSAAAEHELRIRDWSETLLQEFPRSYGALRALHILSLLEWELEDYEAARDTALQIVDRFPGSHLVGTALANAAAAAEELGNTDEARQLLNRLVSGEGAPTSEKARALFNLGRLAEKLGSPAEAIEYYNRLVTEHPDSNWTNLGRNRIIRLNTTGGGTGS